MVIDWISSAGTDLTRNNSIDSNKQLKVLAAIIFFQRKHVYLYDFGTNIK